MYHNENDGSNIYIVIEDIKVGSKGVVIITDRSDEKNLHEVEVCSLFYPVPADPLNMLVTSNADWGSSIDVNGNKYYVGVREI